MTQNIGPLLSQLTSSPAVRLGVCKFLSLSYEISFSYPAVHVYKKLGHKVKDIICVT